MGGLRSKSVSKVSTYLRNEIGHCEDTNDFELYSQFGTQITLRQFHYYII